MVGGDVGQDAGVVRLVAHAAQDDAAPGRLEDRDVDVAAGGSAGRRRGRSSRRARSSARRRGRRPRSSSRRDARPDRRSASAGGWSSTCRWSPRWRSSESGARHRGPRPAGGRGAPAIRSVQRARIRSWAPVRRTRRAGVAASVRQGHRRFGDQPRPFRTDPWIGHDPVARIGRAMDPDPADALGPLAPEATGPAGNATTASGQPRGRRRAPRWTSAWRARLALAVPGPAAADGDLELDHRLEPVDVGTFEESDLDQSHGPARIASEWRHAGPIHAPELRLTTTSLQTPGGGVSGEELERPPGVGLGSPRALPRGARGTSATSTAAATRRPASTRSVTGWRPSSKPSAALVERRPDPAGKLGDTVIGTFSGRPDAGPRLLLIGHMDTVFPDGTAAERPFRIRDGIAMGPGVTDMKSGLLAGIHALAALRELQGGWRLPFERITFVANPDEEIGSPASTPHIRRQPPSPMRRSSSSAPGRTATSSRPARASPTLPSRSSGRVRPTPASSPRRVAARSSRPAPDRRAHPRAQRPLAGRDRQRRGHRRRDAAERRPRAVHARGRRPGVTARASSPAAEAAIRRIIAEPGVPDVTVELEPDGRPLGRWRSSSDRAAGSSTTRVALAARLGFDSMRRLDRRRLRCEHDLRHGRAVASTGWARSAATTTRRRSTSRSPRSCRERSPPRRAGSRRSWRPGGPGRRDERAGRLTAGESASATRRVDAGGRAALIAARRDRGRRGQRRDRPRRGAASQRRSPGRDPAPRKPRFRRHATSARHASRRPATSTPTWSERPCD